MSTLVEQLSPLQNSEFVEEWYEFANDTHFWMQWRFEAMRAFFKALSLPQDVPLSVMDVGAGNGVIRRQIESITKWKVDCVDLNYSALLQMPSGRGRNLYYDILDLRSEYLGKYDLVFALDVIEHLHDTTPFLRAASHHMREEGILIINVPALQIMYSEYDRHVGHFRRYEKESLRQALEKAGLVPIEARYWGASLVPVLAARKLWLALRGRQEDTVQSGFQPPARWINAVFQKMAVLETSLLPHPRWGSSLLMAAKKQ